MSDENKIDVTLHEIKIEIVELKSTFNGFAQSIRRSVEKLNEEAEKNRSFRERATGALLVLGSTSVLAIIFAAARLLLSRGPA